jgi:hypothetical protein
MRFKFTEILNFLRRSTLWATAANLGMCYGPCGEFGDVLCATVANLVMDSGLLQQIWSCAMGYCGKFSSARCASAADLAMRYGPLRGMKPYSKNL